MPKRKLTATAVDKIKPPASGQEDHFDAGYPGLALRVSYGGARSWIWFYRFHKKQRRLTLGRYPAMGLGDAREAWRTARQRLEAGEDPGALPEQDRDTFAAVAAEWLKRDQAGNRTAGEVRRLLDRDVLPTLGDRTISEIGRRDLLDVVDAIADRGAATLARRTHSHLHRLMKWAVGRGIVETNPLAGTPKPGGAVARDRVLTDAELTAVWKAAEGWPFGAIVRLLILTAARREEIGSLRWDEIEGDTIVLAGARTKMNVARTIPLSPQAQAILAALPRVHYVEGGAEVASPYVFTTTGRTPFAGYSKAKAALDAALPSVAPWRLHDLRRTAATGLQRLGVALPVTEAVLGHVGGSRAGVVGVYQRHDYAAEKRAALDLWARHVERIASTIG